MYCYVGIIWITIGTWMMVLYQWFYFYAPVEDHRVNFNSFYPKPTQIVILLRIFGQSTNDRYNISKNGFRARYGQATFSVFHQLTPVVSFLHFINRTWLLYNSDISMMFIDVDWPSLHVISITPTCMLLLSYPNSYSPYIHIGRMYRSHRGTTLWWTIIGNAYVGLFTHSMVYNSASISLDICIAMSVSSG